MLRAATAAAAVLAAFLGVMYLRFSGDTVRGPDPTPSPAAAPPALTTPPSPEPVVPQWLRGMKIVPLVLGPLMELPRDVALILETGCWGCEGGPSGLIRVYVRPDGSTLYEPLIDRQTLGIPPQLNTAPDGSLYEFRSPLTGYAVRSDGSLIVASFCVRGSCGFGGGHYEWTADSQTAIFSSSDGGISWTEIGRLEVGAEAIAILPDDRLLLRTFPQELTKAFQTFPDLAPFEPPVPVDVWRSPDVLPNGEVTWISPDGSRLSSDGRRVLPASLLDYAPLVDDLLFEPKLNGIALLSGGETHPPYERYLIPFDSAGSIGRGDFAVAGDSIVWSGGPLSLGLHVPGSGLIFGNASVPTSAVAPNGQPYISVFVPVAIDLGNGTMHAIRPFFEGEIPFSRNRIAAVQRGPFARVINTDSTCLYVRAEPRLDAPALDCAAEGVLLTDLGPLEFIEGATWMRVRTPAGIEGWASVNYLEAGARS